MTNSGRGGQLPSVPDRGSALDGSSYAALGQEPEQATEGHGMESSALAQP